MDQKRERIFYLDAARALAVLLIVLNHAVNRTWDNFDLVAEEFAQIGAASTLLKAAVTVASHYGVPLFLMITGALILSRPFDTWEQMKRFFRRNWLPLFLSTEIWFFLGYWFNVFFNPELQPMAEQGIGGLLWGCVKTLLFMDQVRFSSMWYLPMIVSIYLMLPGLAYLIHHLPEPRYLLIPLGGVFLCDMVMPTLNSWLGVFGQEPIHFYLYDFNFISAYLIFACLGYWIDRGGLRKLSGAAVAAAGVLSFLLAAALQFFAYSRSTYLLGYMSPLILLHAVCLFEGLRRWGERLRFLDKPITALSSAAFGIYLLHIYFNMIFHWYMDFSAWPHLAKLLFLEFMPIAGSLLIIWPLSRLPRVRRLLFLMK